MYSKEISEHEYFRLNDGRILKDLKELHLSLKNMDSNVFEFHVNSEKNDFMNWVRGVFHEEILADELYRAKTKEKMIKVLDKKFTEKEKKITKQKESENLIKKENKVLKQKKDKISLLPPDEFPLINIHKDRILKELKGVFISNKDD